MYNMQTYEPGAVSFFNSYMPGLQDRLVLETLVYTMSILLLVIFFVHYHSECAQCLRCLGALQMFSQLRFLLLWKHERFYQALLLLMDLPSQLWCLRNESSLQYFSFFPSSSLPPLLSLTFLPPCTILFQYSTFQTWCAFSHLLIQVV